jgi:hypothetical protein
MPEKEEMHEEMYRLICENNQLLKQNHELIRKMYRNDMIGLVLRLVWYGVLIGLPFALYFYILQPYFEAFGANYDVFMQGMAEIPGLKGLEQFFPTSTTQ